MILISTLIGEMTQLAEIANWIDQQQNQHLGVELIAFTHDEDYWQTLNQLLPTLSCGCSFHGPYIDLEGTALPGGRL